LTITRPIIIKNTIYNLNAGTEGDEMG